MLVTVVLLLASGRFIKAIPPSLLVLVLVSSVLPLGAMAALTCALGRSRSTGRRLHRRDPRPCRFDFPQASPDAAGAVGGGHRAVGILDSLLTSLVMDNIRGTRHRNKELIAVGLEISPPALRAVVQVGRDRPIGGERQKWWSDRPVGGHYSVVLFVFVAGLGAVV